MTDPLKVRLTFVRDHKTKNNQTAELKVPQDKRAAFYDVVNELLYECERIGAKIKIETIDDSETHQPTIATFLISGPQDACMKLFQDRGAKFKAAAEEVRASA